AIVEHDALILEPTEIEHLSGRHLRAELHSRGSWLASLVSLIDHRMDKGYLHHQPQHQQGTLPGKTVAVEVGIGASQRRRYHPASLNPGDLQICAQYASSFRSPSGHRVLTPCPAT